MAYADTITIVEEGPHALAAPGAATAFITAEDTGANILTIKNVASEDFAVTVTITDGVAPLSLDLTKAQLEQVVTRLRKHLDHFASY